MDAVHARGITKVFPLTRECSWKKYLLEYQRWEPILYARFGVDLICKFEFLSK